MPTLGRKKIIRQINHDHSQVCFKPCGTRRKDLDRIELECDEMEAIRLADYENLYQQEAAKRMGISRTTFSRLLESARKKVADALLHGKALAIDTKF
ncbi:MAG TPA: DUF134 domain-containing protein [Campylobacterales bacterium]|nr:DUF134 domain-containing protein [Campylobacterales bacterium]HHS92155.1 DUF134 domain-containing protein [Campylobacterales bacterium]